MLCLPRLAESQSLSRAGRTLGNVPGQQIFQRQPDRIALIGALFCLLPLTLLGELPKLINQMTFVAIKNAGDLSPDHLPTGLQPTEVWLLPARTFLASTNG